MPSQNIDNQELMESSQETLTETKNLEKLKIGDLLVQQGLITSSQLDEALKIQKENKEYKPIGEVCANLRFISKDDLRNFLKKHNKRMNFGDLLIHMRLLTVEQLSEALELQKKNKKKLGKILIEKGFLNEFHLVDALSLQLSIPKILPNINLINKELLKGINSVFLKKNEVFPAYKEGDTLIVIMADPLDEVILNNLEIFFKCKIEPAIAPSSEIKKAIHLNFYSSNFEADIESNKEIKTKALVIGDTILSQDSGDRIINMVNFIFSDALMANASDIHIEPTEKVVSIRYRIDGMLQHRTDIPISFSQPLVSRIKILCNLDISEKRKHQDGRIEAKIMDKDITLRVSSYASLYGENIVIRILLRKGMLLDIENLYLSPINYKRYIKMLEYPSGIIMTTGPTGTGKTTTLYASLKYLNNRDKMIITVEDPIEYTIDGIVQGQINTKLGQTYSDFLKSMMRQDPDVIMIGEIRDIPAATAAIQAALTGHKILTTFHTDDTTGALLRLMDMGIDTFLISSTVVSVIAQRLVRCLCPKCKEPYEPVEELSSFNSIRDKDMKKYQFYRAKGCVDCTYTGYKDRIAIHELLVVNDAIRDAILSRKPSGQIRSIARQTAGLITLYEDGFYKASKGITSLAEIKRVGFYNESDDTIQRTVDELISLCEGVGQEFSETGLPVKKDKIVQEESHVVDSLNEDRKLTEQTPSSPTEQTPSRPKKEFSVNDQIENNLEEKSTPVVKPFKDEFLIDSKDKPLYNIRFEVDAIDKKSIKELFIVYQGLKKNTGNTISSDLLLDFIDFINNIVRRLKFSHGVNFVEFALYLKNGKVIIFAETLLSERNINRFL